MNINNHYLKTDNETSFVVTYLLVIVEVVEKWITSKTAREKNELQKRKVSGEREPLRSKTKTQQGFTDKQTKAQVRKNNGGRRGLEHEGDTILNVDNLWIRCGQLFNIIKMLRYQISINIRMLRYQISEKVY